MKRPQVYVVIPGLVPGTHVLPAGNEDVDGRNKSGHDGRCNAATIPNRTRVQ
jgi:hypothetical protein